MKVYILLMLMSALLAATWATASPRPSRQTAKPSA
jgi:hypothetical protein